MPAPIVAYPPTEDTATTTIHGERVPFQEGRQHAKRQPRRSWANGGQDRFLGSIGVRFMVDGAASGGGFSLVEHPMSPRALAAPMHRHTREDEYSYMLEGRVGALLGDEVLIGNPGDLIFKPRGQWHTFWNAGDEPARNLEIISPAGFERFFGELVDLVASREPSPRRWLSCALATNSGWTPTASLGYWSDSACASRASRYEPGRQLEQQAQPRCYRDPRRAGAVPLRRKPESPARGRLARPWAVSDSPVD